MQSENQGEIVAESSLRSIHKALSEGAFDARKYTRFGPAEDNTSAEFS
ncbi:hypothetical protein [Bradymonas sediminis]|nr:hypothetical protein [Bradymonas sediminis]